MTKPAVSKLYHVKAFEVATDRTYEFDVQGLNNLPSLLAHKTGADPQDVGAWSIKRLPILRNSLSYHAGKYGVTSFGPFRVFVERDARDAPHTFTADVLLFAGHDDPGEPIYSFSSGPHLFRALMVLICASLEEHLKTSTDLKPHVFSGRLRNNFQCGKSQSAVYFEAAGQKYMAIIRVARHDSGAV